MVASVPPAAETRKLRSLSSIVDQRELEILKLRFLDGMNQEEVARQTGMCQMTISRLIRSAFQKLKAHPGFIIDFDTETRVDPE